MSIIFEIGLIIVFGYSASFIARKAGIPKVSAFVMAGIIMSPAVSGLITKDFLMHSGVVVDFTLAMVAYMLGGHMRLKGLKKHGKEIVSITIGQGVGAFIFVSFSSIAALKLFYPSFNLIQAVSVSLLFGAISLSTAPAATIATVHELKAKGGFVNVLLAVVALDDALGLMFFALTISMIAVLLGESTVLNHSFFSALVSIAASITLGVLIGMFLTRVLKYIKSWEMLTGFTMGLFCITYGVAETLDLEPLLATMAMGASVANVYSNYKPFMIIKKNYENIILALFFVLAGAHIDIEILISYLPLVIIFLIFRMSGKCFGAYISGTLAKAPKHHSKYIGFALAPQAGVAIGLSLYLRGIPSLEVFSPIIINVIIAKTAINEIIGPMLVKWAISRSKVYRKMQLSKSK